MREMRFINEYLGQAVAALKQIAQRSGRLEQVIRKVEKTLRGPRKCIGEVKGLPTEEMKNLPVNFSNFKARGCIMYIFHIVL